MDLTTVVARIRVRRGIAPRGMKELDWGSTAQAGSRRFGVRPDLQPSHHEAQECLPTGEAKIAGESPDIVEDRLASRQRGADEPVMLVGQLQDRVEEEGPKSVCFQMETAVTILNAKIPTVAGRK